jgi:hypothetical protein
MTRTFWSLLAAFVILVACSTVTCAQGQYIGLVAFKSRHGKYLQAHTEGELHGSNSHVNEEETWLLYVLDKDKGWVRLQNFRNQNPLTVMYKSLSLVNSPLGLNITIPASQCPIASLPAQMTENTWIIEPGTLGRVAIKSKATGKYLTSRDESDDTHCGGEVAADDSTKGGANWDGWWTVEPAPNPPTSGRTVFSVFGDIGNGLANVGAGLAEFFSHIKVY